VRAGEVSIPAALIQIISEAFKNASHPESYLEFDEIPGDNDPIEAFGGRTLKEYIINVISKTDRDEIRCGDLVMAAMYLSVPAYVYLLSSLLIVSIVNDCPESPALMAIVSRSADLKTY